MKRPKTYTCPKHGGTWGSRTVICSRCTDPRPPKAVEFRRRPSLSLDEIRALSQRYAEGLET